MSHTKGPWTISANRIYGGNFYQGICHIMDQDGGVIREANTKLISAAPDLLEACEFAAMYIHRIDKVSDEAFNKLEKAISKAKGGES